MPVLTTLIYRFNKIPIKTSASYFVDIDTFILKYMCGDKRLRITSAILKKQKEIGCLILSGFKTYKATLIKTL